MAEFPDFRLRVLIEPSGFSLRGSLSIADYFGRSHALNVPADSVAWDHGQPSVAIRLLAYNPGMALVLVPVLNDRVRALVVHEADLISDAGS